MHSHQIKDMSGAVMAALSRVKAAARRDWSRTRTPVTQFEAIQAALTDYWADKIAITWTANDVREDNPQLTKAEAIEVLSSVLHNDDATIGINRDTINTAAKRLYPEKMAQDIESFRRAAVAAHAEQLVAAGDLDALYAVFGTRDPNFDLSRIKDDDIEWIYEEYVAEEEEK